jgi:hypothetical protein
MYKANIFRGPHYRADFFSENELNNRIAFTFTERTNRDLDGPGFGTRFLIKNSFDVIAIRTSVDHWYHDIPHTLMLDISNFLIGMDKNYSIRSTYGSSMGGYAAIRFSGELSANSVCAISPLFDISQAWDRRWAADAKVIGEFTAISAAHLSDRCIYTVIYDPYSEDQKHIAELAAVIPNDQLHQLKIEGSGHPSGKFLNQVGALHPITLAALAGIRAHRPNRQIRAARAASPSYFFDLAQSLVRCGKFYRALPAILRALSMAPLNAEFNAAAARIYDRLGDLVSAARFAATAVAANPNHAHMAAYLSSVLDRQRMSSQARYFILRAIELDPENKDFLAMQGRLEAGHLQKSLAFDAIV